jgi:acyl-CoA thioester hydrolase
MAPHAAIDALRRTPELNVKGSMDVSRRKLTNARPGQPITNEEVGIIMNTTDDRDLAPGLSGRFEGSTHILPVRVYYEDTDFSGIVYHANYLRFLERGRTDFLRLAGLDQSVLHAEGDLVFSVRRMLLDFLRPARMDDVVLVETSVSVMKGASITMSQRIRRAGGTQQGETLLTAEVLVAAIRDGRPARLPDSVRALLPQAGGST